MFKQPTYKLLEGASISFLLSKAVEENIFIISSPFLFLGLASGLTTYLSLLLLTRYFGCR
jgi:hypothetical protein